MELIEHERITVLPGAPTIYQSLLAAPGRAERDLSSLRLAVTGAAVVPVVLIERMRDELGDRPGRHRVRDDRGRRGHDVPRGRRRRAGRHHLRPRDPGHGDPDRRPGETGELLLRGEFVMLGYLDDPAATAEAIDADGWLHTGDIGTLDDAGNLTITDRLKDMYISGGFNVYPAEVEQALARLDGVADVAVIGVPDERMGEVGKAYVVRARRRDLTADDVIAFAASGWPTSRCRGTSSSSTHCPATCPARCSRTSSATSTKGR